MLCGLVFSSGALGQTLQPKVPASPPQAQQTPQQAVPQWVVGCNNTSAGLECRAGQTLTYQQGASKIQVSAIVRVAPDTKKTDLLLILPLGTNLPKGVTIQFGEAEAKLVPFQSCGMPRFGANKQLQGPRRASGLQPTVAEAQLSAPNQWGWRDSSGRVGCIGVIMTRMGESCVGGNARAGISRGDLGDEQ
jgi:hypothetical protein